MANGKGRAARAGIQPVDEILRDVEALTNASRRRHRLPRDSPEYAAALESEELLTARIWRLGTALPRRGRERGTKRPTSEGPSD